MIRFTIDAVELGVFSGARFTDVLADVFEFRRNYRCKQITFDFNGHRFVIDRNSTQAQLMIEFDLVLAGCDIYSYGEQKEWN